MPGSKQQPFELNLSVDKGRGELKHYIVHRGVKKEPSNSFTCEQEVRARNPVCWQSILQLCVSGRCLFSCLSLFPFLWQSCSVFFYTLSGGIRYFIDFGGIINKKCLIKEFLIKFIL